MSRRPRARKLLAQGRGEESSAKRRQVEDARPAAVVTTETAAGDDTPVVVHVVKSRKQLRLERKALKKAASAAAAAVPTKAVEPKQQPLMTKEEERAEKIRLRKERRREYLKEQERLNEKERVKERKLRLEKKRRRQINNAPGGCGAKEQQQAKKAARQKTKKQQASAEHEPKNRDLDIFEAVLRGSTDATTGMTTCRLGVRYRDIKVGSGSSLAAGGGRPAVVQNGSLVTVAYRLRPHGSLNVLDSGENFKFRVGAGEVIQGWDIGVVGMRPGGTRQLIVPPKAGYGSRDIGAGSGAVLDFEITVLSC